jgi:hypothetical protein
MCCVLLNIRAAVVSTVFGCLLALSIRATANDGGIQMGGSPGLLNGHPTVTMTSEVISMTVTDDKVTVDCQFVFTNHGPACTVRMGFPDQGENAFDPDEEADLKQVLKTPPKTTFDSFRSYVEGKACKTELIRADEEGKYWHTKMVQFPAHGVLHIRDVYTQKTSGGIANMSKDGSVTGSAANVAYILHTGASWHGNIGRTEVDVNFRGKAITGPLHVVPLSKVANRPDEQDKSLPHNPLSGRNVNARSFPPNTVVWTGPCAPKVEGKTLRFVIENWRPKRADDLQLTYDYKPITP